MANIELENVTYCYADSRQNYKALKNISIEIPKGEFTCIIGESGCGKTTLLRLLAGLEKPTEGKILIDRHLLSGPNQKAAIVFQDYTLFPWMTAKKNITFAIQQSDSSLTPKQISDIADSFLEKVNMSSAANKFPHQLSGGMRQRIAIARALAMDTDILLLDEPFGALDVRIRMELQTLLENLWSNSNQQRKNVIFVTHDIQEAVRMADRVLFMESGSFSANIPVPLPHPRATLSKSEAQIQENITKELQTLFYRNPANKENVYE